MVELGAIQIWYTVPWPGNAKWGHDYGHM